MKLRYKLLSILLMSSGVLRAGQNITISYDKDIKDYASVIANAASKIIAEGGGTLYFNYGKYPVLNAVNVHEEAKNVNISLVGLSNNKGQAPLFFDTLKTKEPHSFFTFQGNIGIPNLTFSISNIVIRGNNQPYSGSHPFVNKTCYSKAIAGVNTNRGVIENVIIENFYGDGIFFAQGMDTQEKKFRVNQPVVRNCKILNTWGWGPIDDSKDGIMMWQVDRPIIENNIIMNDINITKHMGRCGIVLEHNTEGARIRNNKIEGYDRNIHLECDFGGHLIENNELSQSNNGVVLSYDCAQKINRSNMYSPTKILNNIFKYNKESDLTPIRQNDFGFIYIYKPSFVLNNLLIKGNTFVTTGNPAQLIQNKLGIRGKKSYINLNNQGKTIVGDNIFK